MLAAPAQVVIGEVGYLGRNLSLLKKTVGIWLGINHARLLYSWPRLLPCPHCFNHFIADLWHHLLMMVPLTQDLTLSGQGHVRARNCYQRPTLETIPMPSGYQPRRRSILPLVLTVLL